MQHDDIDIYGDTDPNVEPLWLLDPAIKAALW